MIIKKPTTSELKDLIKIYKKAFKKHNILKQSENKVLQYFKDKIVFTAIENKEVAGGIMIRVIQTVGTHSVWKINHLAVAKGSQGKGIGSALVKKAEQEIKKRSKNTIKIELSVSDEEKSTLKFWKKAGYKIEGKLKDHFRYREMVYVLGKGFQ